MEQKYSPFVITQMIEDQNYFLIQDSFIRDNYSQFNRILHQYLDKKISDSSYYRIFRIEQKVSLVYYWKSEMQEPRSNRKGIYLIAGVLCDYSLFCKEPLNLGKACVCLLKMIIEKYRSDDCTEILRRMWEDESSSCSLSPQPPHDDLFDFKCYSLVPVQTHQYTKDIFAQIRETFQFTCHQDMLENPMQQYERKVRFGTCHLYLCIRSSFVEETVPFFVSEASNWICHPFGKMDIASIEGYGEGFIDVRINNLKLPKKMKQVKLLERFNRQYLEIMTF